MIDILHEDEDSWVVVKPTGLASQDGEGLGTNLVDALEGQTGIRPFLVHRLDRDTHGIVCAAKSRAAASRLSALLAMGTAKKKYTALCKGWPAPPAGEIAGELDTRAGARSALTRYATLERYAIGTRSEGAALLDLELGTGRMHQIRRHLASIGCPIIADDKHGDFTFNRAMKKEFGARRLMLAAVRLELPGVGTFEIPMPEHMAALIEKLRAEGVAE